MFAIDLPYVPAQPAITVAQANEAAAAPFNYVFKACQETQPPINNIRTAFNSVHPALLLANYLDGYTQKVDITKIQIKVLQSARHGVLTHALGPDGTGGYAYDFTPGFVGDDQAVFEATYKGVRYKIVLDIKVLEVVDEKSPTCPKDRLMRLQKRPASFKPVSSNPGYAIDRLSIRFADNWGRGG